MLKNFKLSTKCRQLETPKWELPKKFPFWHGMNVKGELPSPLHNPPMRVYALPHKFVYSLIAPGLQKPGAICYNTVRNNFPGDQPAPGQEKARS